MWQWHIIQEPPLLRGAHYLDENHLSVQTPEGEAYKARVINHEIGEVALIGHCLASDREVEQALQEAHTSKKLEAITYLPGSFATVVRQPERTTVLADLAGQFPVYYNCRAEGAHYSTSAEEVTRHAGTLPDRHGIAMLIVKWASSLDPGSTVFADVKRLPGAHKLELTDTTLSVNSYDSLAPRNDATRKQAIVELRDALLESMGRRIQLGQKISADFSGGFDSTSLAFLAASLNDGEIPVFHRRYQDATSGDTEYVHRFIQLNPQLKLHTSMLPDVLPLFGQDKAQPQRLDPDHLVYHDIEQHGGRIHLDGTGADALFDVTPYYLADLWNEGRIKNSLRLVREVTQFAQLARVSPRAVLRTLRKYEDSSPQAAMQQIADDLRNGTVQKRPWFDSAPEHLRLLSSTEKEHLAILLEQRREQDTFDPNIGLGDKAALDELYSSGISAAQARQDAGIFGIEVHTPYLDHNVIRACLKLSAASRHDPRQFKSLMAQALHDIVPKEVYQRRSKGNYSSGLYVSFREQAETLREHLGKQSLLVRLGAIDPEEMQAAITRVELGLPKASIGAILQAARLESWLKERYELPSDRKPHSQQAAQNNIEEMHGFFEENASLCVPSTICAAEDNAGLVLYNLETNELGTLHHNAAIVIKALQQQGKPQDAIDALLGRNSGDKVAAETTAFSVIRNLMTKGFLQNGEHRQFTINRSDQAPNPHAAETLMVYGRIDTSNVTLLDRIRIARSLRVASTLIRDQTLASVTSAVQELKVGLQPSSYERAHRLLVAGHRLGRFSLQRTACQELSLAVVLAEAKAGRSVDLCIGISADPRGLHTWPEVRGEPVQTEHDAVVTGKYTKLGIW